MMTLDELIAKLNGYEWNDIEFKEAQREVPKNAYETVSAFANTEGGWLVFGVAEKDKGYEIIGVVAVDKVQNEFLTVLRSDQKFNRPISVKESALQHDSKTLLVFYIPEVHRQEKPIYLNGDIRRSFIRSGGCDVKCSEDDIRRFLREASDKPYDGQIVNIDPQSCFDENALRWYRKVFNERNPNQDPSISDLEFLQNWGLVVEIGERLQPTLASILLFGNQPTLLNILPRPVVDCQWINAIRADGLPEERWADRLVIETNLVQAWRDLVEFYLKHAERPFAIQPDTLQRGDIPPDYIAFREATINLLIHQDYADQGRKGHIQFFYDQTTYFNPGDAFVSSNELLDPGEREVRNPRIVAAFRRIGLSEQAGTGMHSIFSNWRRLGHVPPIIHNDRSEKSFELVLPKEELLSEKQILLEARLGVHLTEPQAATFAYACRQKRLLLVDVKAVTGFSSSQALEVLNTLLSQKLLERVGILAESYYELAPHLRELLSGPDATASYLFQELDETQWEIVTIADVPRTRNQLMDIVGVKRSQRDNFEQTKLLPLLKNHILQLKYPDQPDHRRQGYVLTEVGLKLRSRHLREAA